MKPLNIIVAVSNNWGIGLHGSLPWRLKKDMAFFKKLTTEAKPGSLKNVVIMGRNTWNSIPEKFRPLQDRINIVVSSTLASAPPGVFVLPNLTACMDLLEQQLSRDVDRIFVIGGSQLYKDVLEQKKYPVRIFCTHVMKDVDCDAFFPKVNWDELKKIELPEVPSEVIEENGYTYKFCVYDIPV
ncbi:Dihydrofolate reductase, variant 2 [Clonorchis sinensis]|uniref:dihydrofolate reductase n=1 Tax=Clonorchis sinensis TaxID=79923 RepID=A0A8T1MLP1_CLOSI|nr:Dihydrofolate reductase, variant 2 [Clonorchis sinensis]